MVQKRTELSSARLVPTTCFCFSNPVRVRNIPSYMHRRAYMHDTAEEWRWAARQGKARQGNAEGPRAGTRRAAEAAAITGSRHQLIKWAPPSVLCTVRALHRTCRRWQAGRQSKLRPCAASLGLHSCSEVLGGATRVSSRRSNVPPRRRRGQKQGQRFRHSGKETWYLSPYSTVYKAVL